MHGYVATSVDAIASRAGVGRATVFAIFGGKPALLKAAYDAAFGSGDERTPLIQRPEAQAVLAERNPRGYLAAYVTLIGGIFARVATIHEVVLRAAQADLTPRLPWSGTRSAPSGWPAHAGSWVISRSAAASAPTLTRPRRPTWIWAERPRAVSHARQATRMVPGRLRAPPHRPPFTSAAPRLTGPRAAMPVEGQQGRYVWTLAEEPRGAVDARRPGRARRPRRHPRVPARQRQPSSSAQRWSLGAEGRTRRRRIHGRDMRARRSPDAHAVSARGEIRIAPLESVAKVSQCAPRPRLDGPNRPAEADRDLRLGQASVIRQRDDGALQRGKRGDRGGDRLCESPYGPGSLRARALASPRRSAGRPTSPSQQSRPLARGQG